MIAPRIETDRLVLRGHELADFDPYAGLFASTRAQYMGTLKRRHAWYSFTSDVAQWALHGFGAWAITLKTNGAFLGQVAVLKPDHFPEPELGWFLIEEAEGKGFAHEAAQEAHQFAKSELKLKTLVSYIDPKNVRSIKLAERLGAQLDAAAPKDDPNDLVYRHWGSA